MSCHCTSGFTLLHDPDQFKLKHKVLRNVQGQNIQLIDNLFFSRPYWLWTQNLEDTRLEFTLNDMTLNQILENKYEHLALKLPDGSSSTLQRVNIFCCDFKLETSSPIQENNVDYGLHYRGILNEVPNSVVALSFYQSKEIIGNVATDLKQYSITPLETKTERKHLWHTEYPDQRAPFCDTQHIPANYSTTELQGLSLVQLEQRTENKCIRMYMETDFDIFIGKGNNVQNVVTFVTGIFNQCATLYANESIPMKLSQLYVWNTQDPYTATTTSAILQQFQAHRSSSFNGDIGQLLGTKGGGGVAAGFNGLCNSNRAQSLCYSGINLSYQNVPTYSWTVNVITHESGHLLGCRHTHACVWNGNNTAIDSCAGSTEGGCSLPGLPSGGGTIMSYCHLTSVGINFNKGFGPQPGNVLRSRFANAVTCLQGCESKDPSPPPPQQQEVVFTGTLRSSGEIQYLPVYRTATSAIHKATLVGPSTGTDFELYLLKWNDTKQNWEKVAQSITPTSSESINYNGSGGFYVFYVQSYPSFGGNGPYTVKLSIPTNNTMFIITPNSLPSI